MQHENEVKYNLYERKIQPKITLHDPLPLSARLRRLVREMPPEALPLVLIVVAAVAGGTMAVGHKLATDRSLRKYPTSYHTIPTSKSDRRWSRQGARSPQMSDLEENKESKVSATQIPTLAQSIPKNCYDLAYSIGYRYSMENE
ncbi:11370_t:CDS:2 [Acaulospora colombiana]|uniref:11370_t:CDS:1 n=1 Tax=Acaulospora colombiana TaxID=27376 RepID=A0ACA9KTF3_9GLOM|nr:11370_t:CDS:2 [Acaulospora colombiana]